MNFKDAIATGKRIRLPDWDNRRSVIGEDGRTYQYLILSSHSNNSCYAI
jgi:hypothetical protein